MVSHSFDARPGCNRAGFFSKQCFGATSESLQKGDQRIRPAAHKSTALDSHNSPARKVGQSRELNLSKAPIKPKFS